jgi:hypothetical protein
MRGEYLSAIGIANAAPVIENAPSTAYAASAVTKDINHE